MSSHRLLLISNSTMHGGTYLSHCAEEIRDFLGGERMELRGTTGARLFRAGEQRQEFTPVCDLSFLLRADAS